jgi:hypothetical protein
MIMSIATVAFAENGTLTVGTATGKAGEDVVIPVTLNADGVTSGVFKISYDKDVLTYKSATTATFDASSTVDGATAGTVKFAFANESSAVAADTALITVTFTVKDGAAVGASTVSAVLEAADAEHHLKADGFFGANGDAVAVDITAGSVMVEEDAPAFAKGDVNADGVIDTSDVFYLMFYTINAESYPITGSGDMNGDSVVDTSDVFYLMFYTINPESYPLAK